MECRIAEVTHYLLELAEIYAARRETDPDASIEEKIFIAFEQLRESREAITTLATTAVQWGQRGKTCRARKMSVCCYGKRDSRRASLRV